MSLYNKNRKYDSNSFMYDGDDGGKRIKIKDYLYLEESIPKITFKMIIEDVFEMTIEPTIYTEQEVSDEVLLGDDANLCLLFEFLEKIEFKEELEDILVSMYLDDCVYLEEIVKQLRNISMKEEIILEDTITLNTLAKLAEEIGFDELVRLSKLIKLQEEVLIDEDIKIIMEHFLDDDITFEDSHLLETFTELFDKVFFEEAISIKLLFKLFDEFYVHDGDLRTAETDFYIGKPDYLDRRYEAVAPFDMMLSSDQSDIPIIPTAEHTYIDIPFIDGTIIQNTTYKNRMMKLVMYTMQGLSNNDKEKVKAKITYLIDKTKGESKRLTIEDTNLTFDVKYTGSAVVTEGASFVKAVVPFETSPYGYNQFIDTIEGSGIIINKGQTTIGAIAYISSGCVNPNFLIGDTEFYWRGTVPSGKTLVIDNEDKTCYLKDNFGNQTQAMASLTLGKTFKLIPKDTQAIVRPISDNTREHLIVEYQPRYLWLDRSGGKGNG